MAAALSLVLLSAILSPTFGPVTPGGPVAAVTVAVAAAAAAAGRRFFSLPPFPRTVATWPGIRLLPLDSLDIPGLSTGERNETQYEY